MSSRPLSLQRSAIRGEHRADVTDVVTVLGRRDDLPHESDRVRCILPGDYVARGHGRTRDRGLLKVGVRARHAQSGNRLPPRSWRGPPADRVRRHRARRQEKFV